MKYTFTCCGHENLQATHKNTLEFTKDNELTLNGDCIVGVNCNFDAEEVKKIAKNCNEIKIRLKLENENQVFDCDAKVNHDFKDNNEIVLRKSNFTSNRTLCLYCDKAAIDIPRKMITKMKDPNQNIEVEFIGKKTTQ